MLRDPENQETAKNIDCLVWCEELDKGARKIANTVSIEASLQGALFYQPAKAFRSGSWLIRCNFTKTSPQIKGYARVPDPVFSWNVPDESKLYAAFPEPRIKIGDKSFRLSKNDKFFLLSKLKRDPRLESAWEIGDAVIPLRELIAR
jgi:hypothetical protein